MIKFPRKITRHCLQFQRFYKSTSERHWNVINVGSCHELFQGAFDVARHFHFATLTSSSIRRPQTRFFSILSQFIKDLVCSDLIGIFPIFSSSSGECTRKCFHSNFEMKMPVKATYRPSMALSLVEIPNFIACQIALPLTSQTGTVPKSNNNKYQFLFAIQSTKQSTTARNVSGTKNSRNLILDTSHYYL